MQRKKIISLACIALFSVAALDGFSQQGINVSSHSATINGLQFDYSIGEMTLVSTERNANLIVTQGLLQPTGAGSSAHSQPGNTNPAFSDAVKVYPNPTQHILFVESVEQADAHLSYQLFDATGKVVLSNNMNVRAGANKFSLDLQPFAAGAYYLMITKPNAQGNIENLSYKIQKTN